MADLNARFDLPFGTGAPRAARNALLSMLQGWGFGNEDWLAIAEVVVSELVTNAVQHGGGCLSLEAQAHDGVVILTVADGSAVIPERPIQDRMLLKEGGRGIAIIEALGCEWGMHDHEDGKRVWGRLPTHPGSGTALRSEVNLGQP